MVTLTAVERTIAIAAAFLLVAALPLTDEAGFLLSGGFVFWLWYRSRFAQKAGRAQ